MNTDKIRIQSLFKIKRIVDADDKGNLFIIVRTKKNNNFMKKYHLTDEDIKNIIRNLSVEDCYSGPEKDRDERFIGPILPFVGGALIGYIAGRPNYNYYQPY